MTTTSPRLNWSGTCSRFRARARIRSATPCNAGSRSRAWRAFFGQIVVPTEKITEIRNNKKRIVERKTYPGYIMVQMELNEKTWFRCARPRASATSSGLTGRRPR